MRALLSRLSASTWLVGALFLLSVFGLLFMGGLVAKPKLLFGRSLNAIEPTLFPTITLAVLGVLAAVELFVRRKSLVVAPSTADAKEVRKALQFFAVLILYALIMVPLGFLISSIIAITLISLLAGNRSAIQIALIATVAPIALYIIATRVLAVSLPELSPIEFAYAWVLGR